MNKSTLYFTAMTFFGLSLFTNFSAIAGNGSGGEARSEINFSLLNQYDKNIERKVRLFFGLKRNINSSQEGIVSDQILEHIDVPSEPFARKIEDGDWLLSGSLLGDGNAKGAIILDKSGDIMAASMLEYVGGNLHSTYEIWIYTKKKSGMEKVISEINSYYGLANEYTYKVFLIK